ncbi:MAG: nodulation protein NfeD [Gammaproteobacteria bacterium]|nr:nodulation protein NfeD [Gammaproteobacteria bacterium]
MRPSFSLHALFLLLAGIALLAAPASTQVADQDLVVVVELEDAIGPASASYFIDSLEDANERGAKLLVLRLDTPGGLDAAMRDMIKAILASEVPVATWVAPSGARAASAGTYIMYASHFAAMASATNIGSSTPVDMMNPDDSDGPRRPIPFPMPDSTDEEAEDNAEAESDEESESNDEAANNEARSEDEESSDEAPAPSTAMERKIINDAVAYIRGLAELRGRNADWAEESVRSGVNLPSAEALEAGVIDMVAQTIDELIEQVNGQDYKAPSGGTKTLALESPTIETVTPDWRAQLLAVITNPSVAVLLISLGSLALVAEFYTGTGVAGVVGAICLLVAAYGMQMLPINYAGLALLILGIALMIAEFFTPTIGIFGFGGAVAFIFGGIFLLDTDVPGFDVSIGLLVGVALVMLILVSIISGAALKSWRSRVVSGTASMIGEDVEASSDFAAGEKGKVVYHGEVWDATSVEDVSKGAILQVAGVDRLTLEVRAKA